MQLITLLLLFVSLATFLTEDGLGCIKELSGYVCRVPSFCNLYGTGTFGANPSSVIHKWTREVAKKSCPLKNLCHLKILAYCTGGFIAFVYICSLYYELSWNFMPCFEGRFFCCWLKSCCNLVHWAVRLRYRRYPITRKIAISKKWLFWKFFLCDYVNIFIIPFASFSRSATRAPWSCAPVSWRCPSSARSSSASAGRRGRAPLQPRSWDSSQSSR